MKKISRLPEFSPNFLQRQKNVCEAELSVSGMIVTFEWEYFKRSFNEKIHQKIVASDKHNSTVRYSDN